MGSAVPHSRARGLGSTMGRARTYGRPWGEILPIGSGHHPHRTVLSRRRRPRKPVTAAAILFSFGVSRESGPSSPWCNSRRCTETGEAPRSQGVTTENIRQYSMEEQRSERGCIAGRMPPRVAPRAAKAGTPDLRRNRLPYQPAGNRRCCDRSGEQNEEAGRAAGLAAYYSGFGQAAACLASTLGMLL